MIRTLIVDDQNLIRQGIKVLLEKSTEIEIVGAVKDGESALQTIETIPLDVVLLDIDLPDIDGLTVANKIQDEFPQVKVIMLSSYEDESYVSRATESGAKGYLLKNVTSEELEWSIKLVHQGYSAFKSELVTTLTPRKQSESSASPVPEMKPVLQTDVLLKQENTGVFAASKTATPNEINMTSNVRNMEALLAKKNLYQRYSIYSDSGRKSGKGRAFYNPRLNRIKKTLMSFEFKLLVFIILFSLGFLVFIALS